MPLDTRYLARLSGQEILDDTPCAKCGYNLIGLKTNDRCPECGRPIHLHPLDDEPDPGRPVEILRSTGRMVDAPREYVSRLAGACVAMAIGGAGMACAAAIHGLVGRLPGSAALAVSALAWTAGTWIATEPRRLPKLKHPVDTCAEWAGLRLSTRLTQPLWFVAAGILQAVAVFGAAVPAGARMSLEWGALAVLAAAYAGLVPLAVQLSHLMYWSGNDGLTFRLRVATWMLSLGPLAIVPWALAGPPLPDPALLGFNHAPIQRLSDTTLATHDGLAFVRTIGLTLLAVGVLSPVWWLVWCLKDAAVTTRGVVRLQRDRRGDAA